VTKDEEKDRRDESGTQAHSRCDETHDDLQARAAPGLALFLVRLLREGRKGPVGWRGSAS
jgi:hypothetical protein